MDFLRNLVNQLKDVFGKLDTTKKIVIGVVLGVVVVSFIVLFSVSSEQQRVMLFAELDSAEFGQVTKKLDEMGYRYTTGGTTAIYVNPGEKDVIITKLAQESMIPKGIPGWKLFDISKWTETDRELDVKYMRALRDEIKRHIESLTNIDRASVEIAITKDDLYVEKDDGYTAAVTVYMAPGYDKLSKKEVKGIQYLVSRAVGNKLKPDNVTITDEFGKIISDFEDDFDAAKAEFTLLQYRHRIEEKVRANLMTDIRKGLEKVFSPDRIQIVRLNIAFNWDKVSEDREEYSPVEMEKDNPATPYSERKVKDSLTVSEKSTKEEFQGHGWNPEGPAGTEGNKPPGYKASDDQFAKYKKSEKIRNQAVNKSVKKILREPYNVTGVSVAIAVDGRQDLPRNPDGTYDLDPMKRPVQVALSTFKSVLDTVKIIAQYVADRHGSGFEDRKRSGLGKMLTSEDLERRGAIFTSDAFKNLAGTRLERDEIGRRHIYVRSAFGDWCEPSVHIDGLYMWNLTADDIDGMVSLRYVKGIEVYTQETTPAEYQRAMTGCGTILIWTK